jgi:hypothetical protein
MLSTHGTLCLLTASFAKLFTLSPNAREVSWMFGPRDGQM